MASIAPEQAPLQHPPPPPPPPPLPSSSQLQKNDVAEEGLRVLVDAFGSAFSLEEIKSAYHRARGNADDAAVLLSEIMPEKTFPHSFDKLNQDVKCASSSASPCGNFSERPLMASGSQKCLKEKWQPVSLGTVSGVIGKDYVVSNKPVANAACPPKEPLKLDPEVVPASQISGEDPKLDAPRYDHMQEDMEDFLFNVLGNGFLLDRELIHEVLGKCGYDMQKSIEELSDYSASNLKQKGKDKKGELSRNSEAAAHEKTQYSENNGVARGEFSGEKLEPSTKQSNLGKELLTSLFTAPSRHEVSAPKATGVRRSRFTVVTGPLEECEPKRQNTITSFQHAKSDDDENAIEEERYQHLRKAVQENRGIMREYYKAAADAFAEGDHARARKLMEKGEYYQMKAHEADEESYEIIMKIKDKEKEVISAVTLSNLTPKEAVKILKGQLSNLGGFDAYLRVVIDTNDGDNPNPACKRLVMKFFEKESIEWIEGETAGIILIPLEKIDRKRFAKK